MEKESLEKIKAKLLEEKERIENELENVANKKGKKFSPTYPEYGSKDEENAAEITEYEIHLALDKNLEKLLTEVVKALVKIENGSYGVCDGCSVKISNERLEAFPSASLCIDCQSKKDNPIKKLFSKLRKYKGVNKK